MILCSTGLSSHIGIDAVTEAHPAAGTAIHYFTHHIERLVGGILREDLVDLGGEVGHHISILIHNLGDVEGLLSHSFLAKSGEGSHHLLDRYVAGAETEGEGRLYRAGDAHTVEVIDEAI